MVLPFGLGPPETVLPRVIMRHRHSPGWDPGAAVALCFSTLTSSWCSRIRPGRRLGACLLCRAVPEKQTLWPLIVWLFVTSHLDTVLRDKQHSQSVLTKAAAKYTRLAGTSEGLHQMHGMHVFKVVVPAQSLWPCNLASSLSPQ